jgi:hypothetical protein
MVEEPADAKLKFISRLLFTPAGELGPLIVSIEYELVATEPIATLPVVTLSPVLLHCCELQTKAENRSAISTTFFIGYFNFRS